MGSILDENVMKQLLSDDDFDKCAAAEIKEMIDDEMSRPAHKRNYDRVAELSQAYAEITGISEALKGSSREQINSIMLMAEKATPKRRYRHLGKYRMMISMLAVVLVVFSVDRIYAAAYNKSIVSTIIHMTKGGVTVNFKETDINETETDPYGMLAECAKYDIYPEVPYYLPEGFKLEYTSNSIVKGVIHNVRFDFKSEDKKQLIHFVFRRCYIPETLNSCIASDEYNISETIVNGHNAVVSKEDNQYVITFCDNQQTIFYMFTQDVPYDECEKIVASIR